MDAFQTGAARAARDESDAAFLAFNVSGDEGRVQDVLRATSYMKGKGDLVDVYAVRDAGLWATFAAAVAPWHVNLHTESMPALDTDEDYLSHFNVPGIRRAGGFAMASALAAGAK